MISYKIKRGLFLSEYEDYILQALTSSPFGPDLGDLCGVLTYVEQTIAAKNLLGLELISEDRFLLNQKLGRGIEIWVPISEARLAKAEADILSALQVENANLKSDTSNDIEGVIGIHSVRRHKNNIHTSSRDVLQQNYSREKLSEVHVCNPDFSGKKQSIQTKCSAIFCNSDRKPEPHTNATIVLTESTDHEKVSRTTYVKNKVVFDAIEKPIPYSVFFYDGDSNETSREIDFSRTDAFLAQRQSRPPLSRALHLQQGAFSGNAQNSFPDQSLNKHIGIATIPMETPERIALHGIFDNFNKMKRIRE